MRGVIENAVRLQALRSAGAREVARKAQVTSYDPNRYAVKVAYQPDGVTSGWLPLASPWVGNGWGMFAPPQIGGSIKVVCIEGSLDAGIAELSLFDDEAQPLSVQAGEFWLVHAEGQFFKLTNDGKLSLSDGQGATLTMNGDGSMALTASGGVNINGANISDSGVITDGSGIVLGTHTHSGVQSGSGTSGPPVA